MKIAIAGAFGFIGQHLIHHILQRTEHEVVAISRMPRTSDHPRMSCVAADLYSLRETVAALEGCDQAVYLVHSMAPCSRLSQGNFRDFDFILADNFARAAKANGVQQLIYVGGMIPESEALSEHLSSRLEVEEVLQSHGIALTAFRCGLVIGPNGSSFNIIVRLTERLPMMILPQWMRTRSNPIYVDDLAVLLGAAIDDRSGEHRTIDAGMDQEVSYKDVVKKTAELLDRSPLLVDVPYVSPILSKLWVRMVSGVPKSLVYPLIDSVTHEMLKSPKRPIPSRWQVSICSLAEAVEKTFKVPFVFQMPKLRKSIKELNEVRSIQRIPVPKGMSAADVANRYIGWLPVYLRPFLKIVLLEDGCEYRVRLFSLKLLSLRLDSNVSSPGRQIFRIKEGLLVRLHDKGRFEFRECHNKNFVIVALHNYRPALPWPVYRVSQAVVHKRVMDSFGRALGASYD